MSFVSESLPKYNYRPAYPNIISSIDQLKGKTSLFVRQTHPDFGVHQETVMEVGDLLLRAIGSGVDLLSFLALSPL